MAVSVSPVEFIRKQANYMESFVMPLALLAGGFWRSSRAISDFS
jgi:hypothetical protein